MSNILVYNVNIFSYYPFSMLDILEYLGKDKCLCLWLDKIPSSIENTVLFSSHRVASDTIKNIDKTIDINALIREMESAKTIH